MTESAIRTAMAETGLRRDQVIRRDADRRKVQRLVAEERRRENRRAVREWMA